AYWGFRDADEVQLRELVGRFPSLFVVRTFSKFFGLPGIRVGFGAAGSDLARMVGTAAAYLGNNSVAEAVALAALDNVAVYRTRAAELIRERARDGRAPCHPARHVL